MEFEQMEISFWWKKVRDLIKKKRGGEICPDFEMWF